MALAASSAVPPKDRTAIRALAARLRRAGKHKPLLLTGRNAKAAAKAVAAELRLDIFRVDLSAVVGKFIGETQQNLNRVFDEVQGSPVVLFEEADALFGKRTGVKDSHDRFANAEVSYLLQRAEAHRGIVMLVSASQRRLPEAVRRRISLHAFPPRRPRIA